MKKRQKKESNGGISIHSSTKDTNISAKIDVWKVLNDKYMRYVTMWFTASSLSVIILCFCINNLIEDQTPLSTKLVMVVVAGFISLAACAISCIVRPRAYRFAEHVAGIETLLSKENGLDAYFQPLPRRPMMKLLIDVSAVMSFIVFLIILLIAYLSLRM